VTTVSIITPVKNGEKYLEECLLSVLRQDYPVEHIIVDGLSTDSTVDILEAYHDLYPDRVIYRSAKDNGVGDAWNWGIKHSRGEILGWLGADDILSQDAVKKVVTFFNKFPDSKFVYGDTEIIDSKGNKTGMYATKAFSYKELLNDGIFVALSSAFYRKSIFDKCGYHQPFGSDYEFYLRVGEHYDFTYLPNEILSQFRIHDTNNSTVDSLNTLVGIYRDSRKHGGRLLSVWGRSLLAIRFGGFVSKNKPIRLMLGWAYPVASKIIRRFVHYNTIKENK
jgi:glycosyltransferase involved in cell wall biosynthesis